MIEANGRCPQILIVDDNTSMLQATEMLLAHEQYDLNFANSGQQALEAVNARTPDVVLLDVMMPEMDGYEVCARLKSDDRWRHVPVILVTALDSKDDVVRGLDAGADDFLTKPVSGPELRARVRSMLRVKQQHDELQETMELRQQMADMIVHDMRNPVATVMLYSDILLLKTGRDESPYRDIVETIHKQANRLNSFLSDMLILAKMKADKLALSISYVDVTELAQEVEKYYREMAESKEIRVTLETPDEPVKRFLDKRLMERTLDNLMSNAFKFSPNGSHVALRLDLMPEASNTTEDEPAIQISVADQGPGVPENKRERIFDRYEIVDQENDRISQIGLGLTLCKMVVEAHGGRIYVQDNQPAGSIFIIEI